MFDKSFYPSCVEGPFGLPMVESIARAVEAAMKQQDAESRAKGLCKLVSADRIEFIDGERADVSVVAADVVDREKEVIVPEGIDLSHFKKNPVVAWGHDYKRMPVGKALWIKYQGPERQIRAKTQYMPRPGDHPAASEWFPDSVYAMVKAGFLPGKSIGFVPIAGSTPTKEEPHYKSANWIVRKSILLEYSVVTVPANQDAIVQAVAKGFTIPADLVGEFHEALMLAEKMRADGKEPPPVANPQIAELMARFETFDLEEIKRLPDTVRRLALEIKETRLENRRLKGMIRRMKERGDDSAGGAPVPAVKPKGGPTPFDIANGLRSAFARLDIETLIGDEIAKNLGRP